MKILSFLVLLPLFAHAAADITNFKGKTYKKADIDQCLRDYDVITKNVDSVEGYTVLSGGCVAAGAEYVQLQFDYIYPLASRIDTITAIVADDKMCAAMLANVETEIASSGNQFVTASCSGKELNTHFIDKTRSVTRSLNRLGKFANVEACNAFIADLTKIAKANKMFAVMSYCNGTSPVFTYNSYFDIEMAVINGKYLPSTTSCGKDVAVNFANNNIKVVHTFCTGSMTYEQNIQENVIYMVPKNEMRYITEYTGINFSTAEACEAQLPALIRGLNSAQNFVLYGFCQKLNDKNFRPNVTYVKAIEI